MAQSQANLEIKGKFTLKDIITAVKELNQEEKEFFIESLLAATSPEYLESIREARQDYKAGRVLSHEDVFGKGDLK